MTTLEYLKQKLPLTITPLEAAEILGVNAQSIRSQAHYEPDKLGFPVIVMGSRVYIPVKPFLKFLGED